MATKRILEILTAALLAFTTVLGGIGGFTRAFLLNVQYHILLLSIAAAALIGAVVFSFRKGGYVMVCILALSGGYLWRQGIFFRQCMLIAHLISRVYSSAYNWGIVIFNGNTTGSVTLAISVLGVLSALLLTWCIIRRKRIRLATLICLLPLFACLVVTNIVPGNRELYLLLLGLALLVITQSVRRRNGADGARLAWLLFVPTGAVLGLLFLLIPREQYQGQERAVLISDTLVSWADSFILQPDGSIELNLSTPKQSVINLRTIGPKQETHRIVMEVTAEQGGIFYLRGQDYDLYDGTGWQSSAGRSEAFSLPAHITSDVTDTLTIRSRRSGRLQYFPYYPTPAITLTDGNLSNSREETVYAWQQVSLPETVWPQAAAITAPDSAWLQLPDGTRQWAEEYLKTQSVPGNGTADMMTITNTIADLVRASAVYDLNTPRMSAEAEDFARWFLEDSETGYCVHFATAAAVLLRAAGIEARLVEGYLIRISAGETVAVTSGNAHAWVEYHVPGIGWLPLETTPPAAELQPAQVTEEKTAPNESTPPLPGATQTEISAKTKGPHLNRIGLPVLFSLLCFSCLLLQRTVRIKIRNTRQRSGSANHCALEKWKHIVLLSQLSREPVPETIEQLALRARFSQHILTAQELAILDQHIQDRVTHLRMLPFPLRLFHRLIRAAY